MMSPEFEELIAEVMKRPRTRSPRLSSDDQAQVIHWLEEAYGLEPQSLTAPTATANRLLWAIQRLLSARAVRERRVSENDVRELCSVITSELMSGGYRRHVADPLAASMEAVNYEKYEDILLRKVVVRCLEQGGDVALIELGSGVGRLLHQYGSCISDDIEACKAYRRSGKLLYDPTSLPNRKRLRLVLGVDFERHMLGSSTRWMQNDRLRDMLERGRIVQVLSSIRHLNADFSTGTWEHGLKVVCVLFQTLGNQLGEDLQVEVLAKARELAGERGVVFVSVFNADSFNEQGRTYYESIRGSVGPHWYFGSDRFVSQKGVYSAWFLRNELKRLFRKARMDSARVLDASELTVFREFVPYIDETSQAHYKRRALVGLWSTGIERDLAHDLLDRQA